MNYAAAFQISATGMTVEKTRLEIAALNLANMHSATPPDSAGFRPMSVVAAPISLQFSRVLDDAQSATAVVDIPLVSIVASNAPPRVVSEPGHPYADERGMVRYPGVDHAAEMLNAMAALRAYEANLAAVGMARSMAARALEIGTQR